MSTSLTRQRRARSAISFPNRSPSNDVDIDDRGLIYLADRFDILEAASVTRTGAHSSGIPAFRRPAKKVASYRVRIFGTPKYRPAFRLAIVG